MITPPSVETMIDDRLLSNRFFFHGRRRAEVDRRVGKSSERERRARTTIGDHGYHVHRAGKRAFAWQRSVFRFRFDPSYAQRLVIVRDDCTIIGATHIQVQAAGHILGLIGIRDFVCLDS